MNKTIGQNTPQHLFQYYCTCTSLKFLTKKPTIAFTMFTYFQPKLRLNMSKINFYTLIKQLRFICATVCLNIYDLHM